LQVILCGFDFIIASHLVRLLTTDIFGAKEEENSQRCDGNLEKKNLNEKLLFIIGHSSIEWFKSEADETPMLAVAPL
jgi:hypothetical protein